MDIIKKKTPHSTHFFIKIPIVHGYQPSRISSQIIADFNKGIISYDQTVSAVPNNSKKYCYDFPLDYHYSITFNGSASNHLRSQSACTKLNKDYNHTNYNRHNFRTKQYDSLYNDTHCDKSNSHTPVYAPLTKKINYLNRTVVLPSSKSCCYKNQVESSKNVEYNFK